MANKLLIKRGNEAQRTFTPDNGEPVWTTDGKILYVGDGVTVGGLKVTYDGLAIAGDTGSDTITPAETFTIAGGTNCSTVVSGNTITINVAGAGTMSSFTLAADSGTPETINDSETVTISGDAGAITTSNVANVLDIAHTDTDGYKHVPTNSTTNNGKVLTATATAGLYTWEDPAVSYSWTMAGDTGSEAIPTGETVTFTGGTALSSAYTAVGNILTYTIDIGTGASQVAAGDHNHDSAYLKLNGGGTLTAGPVTFNDNIVLQFGSGADVKNFFSGTQFVTELEGVDWIIRNSSDVVLYTFAHDGTATLAGDVVISGDLTVNGTTTTVNSTIVTIDDPIFTLGGDTAPATDDNKDRGIEFKWHNGTTAKIGFFGFDDSSGKFTFIPDGTNTSEVFSGAKGELDANVDWSNILNAPTYLLVSNIDDVPVDGEVSAPISSNWAYDHANGTDPHSVYPLVAGVETISGAWDWSNATFDGGTF